MARTKNQTLGTINWTADKNALIWRFLGQSAKKENQAALYGEQKGNVRAYIYSECRFIDLYS